MQKNDLSGARRSFARALQLDRRSVDALFGLTEIDVREKDLPSARARVEAGVAANPDDPEVLVLAGRVLIAVGDHAKAETLLRRVLEVESTNIAAYTLLGQIYATQGRLDDARSDFDRVASGNPKDISSRTMSAMILHAQGEIAEAKKRYMDILALDTRAVVAANNLAWIYADEGLNLDLAVQLAERAVEQLPDNAEMRDTLGWVYWKKQVPSLAVGPFEDAVKKNPENATFRYHAGLAYARTGDEARARDAFEMALKLRPEFADARRELTYLNTGAQKTP
jgi:Flp pilus assembly protein TadD